MNVAIQIQVLLRKTEKLKSLLRALKGFNRARSLVLYKLHPRSNPVKNKPQ